MPPPRTLRHGGIFIGRTEKIIDKKCCIAYYWYIAQWKNRRVHPPSPLGERPFRGGETLKTVSYFGRIYKCLPIRYNRNKGNFRFPKGEVTMKNNRKPIFWRRGLALLLAVCLAAGYVPVPGYAEGCTHAHGEDCYEVTTQCVHSHDESCYTDPAIMEAGEEPDACAHVCAGETGCVTKALNCAHIHDSACGEAAKEEPKEEPQPEPQPEGKEEPKEEPKPQEEPKEEPKPQEEPKEEPKPQEEPKEEPKPQEEPKEEPEAPQEPQVKTVTAWTWLDEEEALDPETGKLCLVASEEAPIFLDQIVEVLPQAIEATVDGEGETLPVAAWTCGEYPEDGAYEGSFVLEAELPEGYALGDGVEALHVAVEFGGAVTLAENTVGVSLDGSWTRYATFDEAMMAVVTEGLSARSVEVKLYGNATRLSTYTIRNDMTLDLNGNRLEGTGTRAGLSVGGGTLTLKDSSQNGGGSSNVKFETAGGRIQVDSGEWEDITARNGSVTVDGGKVNKITAYNPVTLKGGKIDRLAVDNASVISLSYGTFEGIYAINRAVLAADLLAPGYAFRWDHDQKLQRYKDLPTLDDVTAIGNTTVVQCQSHVFETGNPNCIYCNTPCTHPTVNQTTGACETCGKVLYDARLTIGESSRLFESMNDAFRALGEGVGTVTLLRDVNVEYFFVYQNNVLDGNGHTITGRLEISLRHDKRSGGVIQNLTLKGSPKVDKDDLSIPPVFGDNCVIYGFEASSGELLALVHDGYAFFTDEGRTTFANSSWEQHWNVLYTGPHTHDFTTGTCACGAQCDHKTIDMTTGKCAACSKQLYQAKIGTTGYVTLNAALIAAQGIENSTVTVLCDIDVPVTVCYGLTKGTVTLDLNGHKLADTERTDGTLFAIDGADFTIKGTAAGSAIQDQRISAIALLSGNLAIHGGSFGRIDWSGGRLTITDGEFESLYYSGNPTATISGGTFQIITVYDPFAPSVWHTLKSGYAFFDVDSKKVVDASGQKLKNVYVSTHTHTKRQGYKTCACGYAFPHATVTKAPEPLKLTYTGQTQTLVTQGTAEGGEMLYSLEKDGYYGKTVPFGIVKTYTVYYMVRGDSGHLDTEPESVTVTIKPTKRLLDLTGLNLAGDITIDGVDYPIEASNDTLYVTIPETGDLFTYYGYKNIWASNEHSNYPTSMSVYAIERTPTGSTAREITELQDLLTYAGCSIRISGKQGIRMITALDEATKKALTGKGLAGYTLEEYGTVVSWTNALGNGSFLRLGESYASSNYAYRKGEADPVFARKNGFIQYTNVLVLENLTEADYDKDLTLRAYIQLRNTETGETVTLYGGTVTRSIYYVAKQNADTYKPGTAGHKFVRKIINAVENRT